MFVEILKFLMMLTRALFTPLNDRIDERFSKFKPTEASRCRCGGNGVEATIGIGYLCQKLYTTLLHLLLAFLALTRALSSGRKKSNYWFCCFREWHSLSIVDDRHRASPRNWAQINMINCRMIWQWVDVSSFRLFRLDFSILCVKCSSTIERQLTVDAMLAASMQCWLHYHWIVNNVKIFNLKRGRFHRFQIALLTAIIVKSSISSLNCALLPLSSIYGKCELRACHWLDFEVHREREVSEDR